MAVYVIGCEGSRLVKIGSTDNMRKRLRGLGTQSAHPVKLLWQSHAGHGANTERELHRIFRDRRRHGEWFDFGEDDPVALVSAAIELPHLYLPAPRSSAQRLPGWGSDGPEPPGPEVERLVERCSGAQIVWDC